MAENKSVGGWVTRHFNRPVNPVMEANFLTILAIGDAFGAGMEYVDHDIDWDYADLHYRAHPTHTDLGIGCYTDDTQMSIANAELLLTGKTHFTDDEFIESWLNAYRRDPRVGYTKYFQQVMATAKDPADFRSMINGGTSSKSGAAMRAGVFGLLSDVDRVKDITIQQANITHNSPAGRTSALAIALGVHYLHHGGNRMEHINFIKHHLGNDWNGPANGYQKDIGNGLYIANQVAHIVFHDQFLTKTLLNCMNWERESDTDTLCGLAAMMASRDAVNDLPHSLYATLENGAYGLDYLQKLDVQLMQAFPRLPLYKNGFRQAPTIAFSSPSKP